MNDGDRETNLYCVHSISGDVGDLQKLAIWFEGLSLHGIQIPKHQMTERFVTSIETIAEHHVNLLLAFQPTGPINLLGWSAGAIVALEMAQQLRDRGRVVPLLIILDGAPCNTNAGIPPWNPLYFCKTLINVPRWINGNRADWSLSGLLRRFEKKIVRNYGVGARRLTDDQTLDAKACNGLLRRDGWSPDQKSFIFAFYKAVLSYIPKPYDGDVLVFESLTQPLFHLRQVGAIWRKIAKQSEILSLKGSHSELLGPSTAHLIAQHVLPRLCSRHEATSHRSL